MDLLNQCITMSLGAVQATLDEVLLKKLHIFNFLTTSLSELALAMPAEYANRSPDRVPRVFLHSK